MLIRNLKKPGDYARAVLAHRETLRQEIANDNRQAAALKNEKKGILQEPTPEQDMTLSERLGDDNTKRQRAYDSLIQVFTPDQVKLFMSSDIGLRMNDYEFINLYWKDMKQDLVKRTDPKLMTDVYFKLFLQKYEQDIFDHKGLSSSNKKDVLVNEMSEVDDLMKWRPEAMIAYNRLRPLSDTASKQLKKILEVTPSTDKLKKIEALSDANKQNKYSQLSDVFNVVESDPMVWKKANSIRDDATFYDKVTPLFMGMDDDRIDFVKALYKDLEPTKAKRGQPAEAIPLIGELDAPEVEARPLGSTDYMSPADFQNERKGKQNEYISLLSKVLPPALKTQVFYNRETGKQNSVNFYTQSGNEVNKETFYARLVSNDKEIKKALSETKGSGLKGKPGRQKSGKGIASTCREQTPRWIELGRYRINGRLLDEKQLLSVRFQSGTAVPAFPKMIPISDAFHELLSSLFETKKLDKRLMKELDPEEQRSAETLLVKSGVGRSVGVKEITPTDEEAKKIKRFDIVKGSYLAGNNAPEILHELRSLIIHFIGTHHLSRKEGLRALEELV